MCTFSVTDVIVHTDPTQVHLLIDGELLETTPEHPFYTLERGWVDAGDLWVGAHIRKADGSYGMIQFLTVEREPQVMYNLTVDEAHTFFVGAQRWLVHNSGCDIPELIGDRPGKLLPQAVTHAKAFTGMAAEKADFVEALYGQIRQKSVTRWEFNRYNLPNGWYAFDGLGGFVTAISPDAKLWRGDSGDFSFDPSTLTLLPERLSEL
ncbi:MAG: polymorphic toxin-type HINT domain-containing protein [Chloroflexota bacterium]